MEKSKEMWEIYWFSSPRPTGAQRADRREPTWRPKEVPLWYSGNEFKNLAKNKSARFYSGHVFVPPQA